MMAQTRTQSFAEAVANTVIGFVIALLTQMAVFPMVGIALPADRHLFVGTVFTAVSLARSYVLHRVFELFRRRGD